MNPETQEKLTIWFMILAILAGLGALLYIGSKSIWWEPEMDNEAAEIPQDSVKQAPFTPTKGTETIKFPDWNGKG